jgi:hypothetical protein
MPFVAEGILCRQKIRLPDRAAGASVQCPRCGSHFTAAPPDELLPAVQRAESSTAKAHFSPATTHAESPPTMPAVLREEPAPTTNGPDRAVPAVVVPELPIIRETAKRRAWIDPLGLGALATGGIAVACAYFYVLAILVIPLAGIGLAMGLLALGRGLLADRPTYVMATAASVLNMAVLLAGSLFPSILGPTYQLARARFVPEVAVPRVVPLAGKKSTPADGNVEWPDARRFSVQVKGARVEVVAATVRPIEVGTAANKKSTQESYLLLRVRTHQAADGAEFVSGAWHEAAAPRPSPNVTDNTGRTYRQPPIDLSAEAGMLSQKPSAFPLGITDEVYVFEAPGLAVDWLRLEMPAAAWGGRGAVRFSIPREMLQIQATPPRAVQQPK